MGGMSGPQTSLGLCRWGVCTRVSADADADACACACACVLCVHVCSRGRGDGAAGFAQGVAGDVWRGEGADVCAASCTRGCAACGTCLWGDGVADAMCGFWGWASVGRC